MTGIIPSARVPVLIAGAGPVGLSLAIELAYRGIRCLIVEQTDGSVEFPTTNLANTRTVEHLRRWGIADKMRFESGYPTDYPRNYLFVTRMDGYEIAGSTIRRTATRVPARPTVRKAGFGFQNLTSIPCCTNMSQLFPLSSCATTPRCNRLSKIVKK